MTEKRDDDAVNHQNKHVNKVGMYSLNADETEKSTCGCYAKCCSPQTSPVKIFAAISACAFAGIVFGWCMEKSRGT